MPAADNNENAEPNSNLQLQPHPEVPSLPTPKPLAQGSLGPACQGSGLMARDTEYDTAAQQAVQEQQHDTPRRRRAGWGTPQPPQAVPDQQIGSSTYAADHSAAAGLANSAKQEKQVTLTGSESDSLPSGWPQHVSIVIRLM